VRQARREHRHPHLIRLVRETGRSGWYLRVLEPGSLRAGDAVRARGAPPEAVSVGEVNAMLRGDPGAARIAQRLQTSMRRHLRGARPSPRQARWVPRRAPEVECLATAGRRVDSESLEEPADMKPEGRTGAARPGATSDREALRALTHDRTREEPDDDQAPGDLGTELFEEERDRGLRDQLESEREGVERAERRLADGRYGLSVESGEPIPDARLEAVPWAERTVEEEERAERS
jgi:RNA polymerase-binding transcription factor DksA